LLAWGYFVRPTSNLPIVAITLYVAVRHRSRLYLYLATGAFWLLTFAIYSWHLFGTLFPNYYLARRLSFNIPFEALAGHLFSPSRGLVIYVPVLLFVIWILFRYRRRLQHRSLLWLAGFVVLSHLIIISGFDHWWGGFCYGSRLTASLVPWFVLLSIIGIKGMLARSDLENRGKYFERGAGFLLLALSIFINARGALARETWKWNIYPENVDNRPSRLWDWHDPQLLAGLIRPPQPPEFPLLSGRLQLAAADSGKYLWYGWSGPESDLRWTDGEEATMVFSVNETSNKTLQVRLLPYLVPGKLDQQRVEIDLNGKSIASLTLTNLEPAIQTVELPVGALQSRNVLTLKLPDAVAPAVVESSYDTRPLGVAIWWVNLDAADGLKEKQ
jgi:hypothetical protein